MGTRSANRRGLMNSSMGIGAAHNAVLGAATPIASQEAQQVATKNLAFMEGKNQRDINTANLAAAERERQLAALTNLVTNSQSSIAGTLQNHEIPGATRAAVQQSINDQTAAAIAAMERLYGTRINWGTLNPAITSQPGALGIGGGYGAGTGVRV
ncbi:hypothetical protein [Sphingomonas sp.]|uniref:hypothetical protein n=1 Tax=Sphingomonas sp. TaxID=28214 RepID=UPI00307D35ED